MNKFIIIPLLVLSVSSCSKTPVSISATNNPDVSVALLFEHDGCKVYRFADDGNHYYFAKCENNASVSETHTKCAGKTCYTEHELVTTVYK